MRGLTLYQPYATLMALRAKKYETRSWGTKYVGAVAIQSSKGFPRWCKDICSSPVFEEVLDGVADLPLGKIIAVGRLVRVVRTEDIRRSLSWPERSFGNYASERFAWQFEEVIKLRQPIDIKGMQGLWMMPVWAGAEIIRQLSKDQFKAIYGREKA